MNNKNIKLEVGDIVRVNYVHDDSEYNSDKYGVGEAECCYYIASDPFVVIYVSRNRSLILAQRIIQSRDLQCINKYIRTDHIVNISKNGLRKEVQKILGMKEAYNLKWQDIDEDVFNNNYWHVKNVELLYKTINNIEFLDKEKYKLYL